MDNGESLPAGVYAGMMVLVAAKSSSNSTANEDTESQGSRIYKDRIAEEDDPQVELLERNGAIIIGKTNIPEFAAGSNTYNEWASALQCSFASSTRVVCAEGRGLAVAQCLW